ncbi:MAG: hypothetical protein KJZ47_13265 [Gemmatimonadales bacterium]|nr:hypothetical protein [Gemmatimonadales bacterium]
MPFPPPKDHRIDLDAASKLTRRFREAHPGAVKASLFPNDVFLQLLGNKQGAGIRIYYGADEKGNITPVLCSVDANGNDLLPGAAKGEGEGEGNELMEFGYPCPIYCGDGNSLNGE